MNFSSALENESPKTITLSLLFDRISTGGIIVFDDYGQLPYIKQQIAENEFFTRLGYQILEIPTGQGVLIKR